MTSVFILSEELMRKINSSSEEMKAFIEATPEVKDWIKSNSTDINQKVFFMYLGIDYPKTSLIDIAKDLDIVREVARQKKDKVIHQFINHFREK